MFTKFFLWMSGIGHNLLAFLEPVIESETGKLLDSLLPIAQGIVAQVATTGKLPNEKRGAAVAQLKMAAVDAGIDAAASVLNTAIELAYQHMQATQSKAVSASVPATAESNAEAQHFSV